MSEQQPQKEELKPEADAPKATEEELKQEDPKAPEDAGVIDYKAQLEKAQAERDNYKTGMLNAKEELKKTKTEDVDTNTDDIDDKVSKLVDERFNKLQSSINVSTVESTIDSISSNDDEKALIRDIYENKINHSGVSAAQVRSDLEDAKLIANKSKIINENEELKTSLIAKQTMTISGGSNTNKPDSEAIVKISPADRVMFDRMNFRRTRDGKKPLTEQEYGAKLNK